MANGYTTPFQVWSRIGKAERHRNTGVDLTTGKVVDLEEYVIPEKLKVLDASGVEISDSDYEIDTDFNQLEYTGSDRIENATINYITGPVRNDRSERGVEQATSHVDNHLNTTFGGLRRRVDEVYRTDGGNDTRLILQQQPVQEVEEVYLNTNADSDEPPTWEQLQEDRDYIQDGRTGIKLLEETEFFEDSVQNIFYNNKISRSDKQVKITYQYGYEDLPADIQNLAEIMLMTDSALDTVFGAVIEGRDGFNPQSPTQYRNKAEKIKMEWTRNYYNNFSQVVTQGEDEAVQSN